MLYLLSPAKSLDYDTPTDPSLRAQATKPQFLARSAELIDVLQRKTPAQVAELMSLSDALAALNVARYGVWSRRLTARNSKPAVAATYPWEGNIAVRPVRVTNWPVISEPRPTPKVSGSNSKPVSTNAEKFSTLACPY